MFKRDLFRMGSWDRTHEIPAVMATIAAAQVHATLALVCATHGEPNRTTKHMEMARAYLAEVEEEPRAQA